MERGTTAGAVRVREDPLILGRVTEALLLQNPPPSQPQKNTWGHEGDVVGWLSSRSARGETPDSAALCSSRHRPAYPTQVCSCGPKSCGGRGRLVVTLHHRPSDCLGMGPLCPLGLLALSKGPLRGIALDGWSWAPVGSCVLPRRVFCPCPKLALGV